MIITPFETKHIASIRAFNADLRAGGSQFAFPEIEEDDEWPRAPGRPVFRERYVAVDDDGVHGGYMLKHQRFVLRGIETGVGQYALPLSRGVVDARFRSVGRRLLEDVIARQPRLFGLGMGGLARPFPRQLAKAGFAMSLVPFYFKIVRARRFFDEIRLSKPVAAAAILAARAAEIVAIRPTVDYALVETFGDWADEIWRGARERYEFIGVRDSAHLQALFADPARYLRLRVRRGDRDIGWALLVDTVMRDNHYFGNLRVGTIADNLALPGDEEVVVAASTQFLRARGVDLIVSNQSHSAWRRALVHSAFLKGPSNYGFGASPRLAADLPPLEFCHLTRGDGSGPIHL